MRRTSGTTPTYPELRNGSALADAEDDPAAPRRGVRGSPTARPPAAADRRRRAAARARDPIVVVGCGTSLHGAAAVADLSLGGAPARASLRASVEARDALEPPSRPRTGGLTIGILTTAGRAHRPGPGGRGRRRRLARRLVRAAPTRAVAEHAGLVLATTLHDRSGATPSPSPRAIRAGAAPGEAHRAAGARRDAAEARLRDLLGGDRVRRSRRPRRRFLACGTRWPPRAAASDRVTARELGPEAPGGRPPPTRPPRPRAPVHGHLVALRRRTRRSCWWPSSDRGGAALGWSAPATCWTRRCSLGAPGGRDPRRGGWRRAPRPLRLRGLSCRPARATPPAAARRHPWPAPSALQTPDVAARAPTPAPARTGSAASRPPWRRGRPRSRRAAGDAPP